MNEYKSIIHNPFKGLHQNHVEVYYILLNYQTHLKAKQSVEEDGSIIITNKQIALSHKKSITAISKAITHLAKHNLIKLVYSPSRYGRIRKIYIIGDAQNGD